MRFSSVVAASAAFIAVATAAPAPSTEKLLTRGAAASPITIPIHRRAGGQKRDLESFERKVAHMKARYGAKSESGRIQKKRAGTVTLTNFQDSEFYGAVSVGSPAVNYSMILDTGSSDMILATSGCNGCSSSTPGYSPSSSTTSSASSTPFQITYGSGSASGTLVSDTVGIAGYSRTGQVFAACDSMENVLDGEISGILGLGWSNIASSGATPLVEALAEAGTLPAKVFGFSFKSYAYDELTSETMAGGSLTVGGTDTSAYTGDMNWIPIALPGGYWAIPLDDVSAGGSSVGIKAAEVVIDTGTTLVGAPTADVQAIYAQIPQASPYSLNGESGYYSIPCNANINVTFTFAGVEYAIPSDSFNAGAVDSRGSACLGAIFALETSSTISWIIGDAFLTSVYNAYRFDGTPAVGFAKLGSGGSAVQTNKNGSSTSPAAGRVSLLSSAGVAIAAVAVGATLW